MPFIKIPGDKLTLGGRASAAEDGSDLNVTFVCELGLWVGDTSWAVGCTATAIIQPRLSFCVARCVHVLPVSVCQNGQMAG